MNNVNNNLKEILELKISKITPDEWDEYFLTLKQLTIPSNEKRLSRKAGSNKLIGRNWSLSNGVYDGSDSLDKRYVDYINDVLKVIRSGKKSKSDFCYKIYQVADLLRFEINLKSRLIHSDGCSRIEVWLDK